MGISKGPDRQQHPLGQALAEWRTQAGLSQTELAGRVAYHRTTVTHAERGRTCLSLGQFAEAKVSAERALAVHVSAPPKDRSPSREAIARIDLGMALATLGEPEEACGLGRQALASGRIVDSVLGRASELGTLVTRRFPALAEGRELVEQVRTLNTSGR